MKRSICIGTLVFSGACAQAQLTTELLVDGVNSPVVATHAGDGTGRLFIVNQSGIIRVADEDGTLNPTPYLDITGIVGAGGERGLLGLAFHPEYASNGRFFVNYTGNDGDTRVAEYQVSAGNPDVADASSGDVIFYFDQPFGNHNGGWIGFGGDDYLYIATGDGGSGNDPLNAAGNLSSFLGKMHRIDVDGADAFPGDPNQDYAIPADNPFVGVSIAVQSIWAYGLRNPWRNSFDRETGDLWIGDVGQNAREEVNFQAADSTGGEHYGWRCREGFLPTGLACGSTSGFTDPVHDYSSGCSVVGGYAYRGCELGNEYVGLYFFSDYCTGTIWTLDRDNGFAHATQFSSGLNVSSFGETESGELLICDLFGDRVYKIVNPSNPDSDNDGTPDSCDTACAADLTGDGVLDFFDVSAFLNAFNSMDPVADFDENGVFDFFDVSAFLNAFNAGCP